MLELWETTMSHLLDRAIVATIRAAQSDGATTRPFVRAALPLALLVAAIFIVFLTI